MKKRLLKALCTGFAALCMAGAADGQVRISQVYGGGGNSMAVYTNDFVELYNPGPTAQNLTGWSVQYASSAGSSWGVASLSGSIGVGQYYLIQLAAGNTPVQALPTPDATGTLNLAGTNGKVALCNSTTALTGTCPTGGAIVDFVGFGSANCFEGAGATAMLSNSTAAIRNGMGCDDTDNNNADFTVATPTPRNTSSPTHSCGATTGACCNGMVCTETTMAGCGGTFQGVGSSCMPVDPCIPPPTGACCDVSGFVCTDLTEMACGAITGSTWHAGEVCGSFVCPLPEGTCCDGINCTITTQAACTGTWTQGGTCTPTNPCDPGAACCFTDGACIIRSSVECGTLGGSYGGVGSVCTACPPASPGACCTGASCATSADPVTCFNSGGQFKGAGTVCTPNPCYVGSGTVIATFDFDTNIVGTPATNLSFSTNPDLSGNNGQFSNAFDVFGVINRANTNNDFKDDSLTFPTDAQGILTSTQTSNLFGVEDLANNDNLSGTGTATWTFDVTGYTDLNISIDFAAMGNFEQYGSNTVLDIYDFTVSIDAGSPAPVFTSHVVEGLQPTYTLESGSMITTNFNDPVTMNGTLVLNQFVTLDAPISGSGATLTLTFNASNDGGGETFAFDNIVIRGTPIVANSGACCLPTNTCVPAQTQSFCETISNGTYQGNGSTCTPDPCPPATGPCCCGANCTVTTLAACPTGPGTNSTWTSGGVCTPFSNTAPCCRGDYNKSGGAPSVQDIFDFLAGYFGNNNCADANDSGGAPSVQDIFDFLAAYFGGC